MLLLTQLLYGTAISVLLLHNMILSLYLICITKVYFNYLICTRMIKKLEIQKVSRG